MLFEKSSDSKKIINILVSALRNAFLIAKDLNVTPFRQTFTSIRKNFWEWG